MANSLILNKIFFFVPFNGTHQRFPRLNKTKIPLHLLYYTQFYQNISKHVNKTTRICKKL